ncbi:MAG: heparinase II/III family protein, partial [Lentisphaeria bacterium]|nr:heparinase II/III family protein [Lentisphaeria bacterium]
YEALRQNGFAGLMDTGEMAVALSVGAACFDPVMTPEEKKIVADALWEKAVMMSIPDNPDGRKLTPDARPQLWWLTGYNNWVPVCHSGVVAAALIAGDRDPDTAAMVIQRAIRRLPVSMRASYSPNGSYPEGPGYWGYGSEFNSVLIALLDHAFGTNFGLADIPGWSTTGNYMAAVTAPSGDAYNYSDGGARVVPILPWFFLESRYPGSLPLTPHDLAVLKKRSEYKAGKTKLTGDRLLPLALIWLGQAPAELPERPLWYYSGDTSSMPLVIFRSAWTPDAVYLGIKGGGPKAPHAHMDAGSFLIEAEGVRWVTELGMEPYNPLELRKLTLWNSAQESDRWRVFRIGPDSHSIVRINAAPQLVNGWGTVKSLHTDPGKPMQTTLDLKSLYHNIDKFERTAELSDQGVRISDTLAGLHRGARVRFQFCTKAAVEIQGNTVILRSQDKAMKVVLSEPSITWQSADAKQWMQEWDSDNGTAQMVWFETAAPESGKVAYTVDYIPGKVAGIPAE